MYILDHRAGSLEKERPVVFRELWQLSIGAIHNYWSKAANRQNLQTMGYCYQVLLKEGMRPEGI